MENLSGRKVGIITIVGLSSKRGTTGQKYWECKCECGNSFLRREDKVKVTTSCGCLTSSIMSEKRSGKWTDWSIVGQRFGNLVVLSYSHKDKNSITSWNCRCDCGNEKIIAASSFKSGRTKSCGCLYRYEVAVGALRSIYRAYSRAALSRGLEFSLDLDEVEHLVSQNCAYCGEPPTNYKKHRDGGIAYSGIDRIDNDRGYTIENCVPCCKMCNKAKNNHSLEEFLLWVDRVHDLIHSSNSTIISVFDEFFEAHK